MRDQLISAELVSLAKEKGFDVEKYIKLESSGSLNPNNWHEENNNGWYYNISQSLLQKWLREDKKIVILIYLYDEDREDIFSYDVIRRRGNKRCVTPYLSYEEALEKGLFVALKLIR
jgi:hypothetical protein